ncbi:MAG: hypothetical protein ACYDHP_07740 [Ferrimicrobium sp.]
MGHAGFDDDEDTTAPAKVDAMVRAKVPGGAEAATNPMRSDYKRSVLHSRCIKKSYAGRAEARTATRVVAVLRWPVRLAMAPPKSFLLLGKSYNLWIDSPFGLSSHAPAQRHESIFYEL